MLIKYKYKFVSLYLNNHNTRPCIFFLLKDNSFQERIGQ